MQAATVGAEGMLLGRRSYDILRQAWSTADDSEPAVAAMNRMPKYVVSSSAGELAWSNSHLLGGELSLAVAELTDRAEGDLVIFGSATLVRGLARHDLVDEYRLLLFPVVLGAGKRIFDENAHRAEFTLTDSLVTSGGVAVLTYTRDPSG